MEYYCLAVRVGSEKSNMDLLRRICRNELGEKKKLEIIFPLREVKDHTPYGLVTKRLPLLDGYIMIATEYDLSSIATLISRMSPSSYGLARNPDRTYALRGSERAYAEWVFSCGEIIKESRVKVRKTRDAGTIITVIDGPIKQLDGKCIRIKKKTKCLVEFSFMGEVRRVNLPVEIVEEIDESEGEE